MAAGVLSASSLPGRFWVFRVSGWPVALTCGRCQAYHFGVARVGANVAPAGLGAQTTPRLEWWSEGWP